MKNVKAKLIITAISSLLIGLIGGYCIGYFPMKKEVKKYEYNFEYYRD